MTGCAKVPECHRVECARTGCVYDHPTDPTPLEENRVAKIPLSPEYIGRIMQLPEGMKVERVWAEHDPMSLFVYVSSPDLDQQPPNSMAPILSGAWGTEVLVDDDGKTWVRWGWTPDG